MTSSSDSSDWHIWAFYRMISWTSVSAETPFLIANVSMVLAILSRAQAVSTLIGSGIFGWISLAPSGRRRCSGYHLHL
ncbi:hypothetical protein Tco_0081554, partial [Tanacetum coccineum]